MMFGFLLLIMAGIAATGINLWIVAGSWAPGPIVFFTILTYFAVLDVRYLRRTKVKRSDRLKRHALRMALIVSETVRAPLLTFSDALAIPFPAIVFGSFLLVPLLYFAFTPSVLRGNYTVARA